MGVENSKTKDPEALQKQLELGEHIKKGTSASPRRASDVY